MVHTPGVTKLVRDNIESVDWPDWYGGNENKVHLGKAADREEYIELLRSKLLEETTELLIAVREEIPERITEEAADVIEVVRALATAYNIPLTAVTNKRVQKLAERGGFSAGITYNGP
jgi:predicted house-cleaning noncanonical NTP pyrophosphatase (MazG superfamily)